MTFLIHEVFKRALTGLLLIVCLLGAYIHSILLFSLLLCALLVLIIFFEWPYLIGYEKKIRFVFFTLIYPVTPVMSLIYLNYRYHKISLLLPLYPIFIAWTADTFGYLVGKSFGKHKICPSISPGKSWEGLAGSFAGISLVNFFVLKYIRVYPFSHYAHNIVFVLLLSLALTIIAFMGGTFISILKRKRGVKDTGSVLPGHGGFLDRFDSVFSVVIAVWLIIGIGYIQRHSVKKLLKKTANKIIRIIKTN